MTLSLDKVIPATGEWTLSVAPNDFIVTLVNDTPYLTQYQRIAIIARVGDKVGETDDNGKAEWIVKIGGLREVDGHLPGPEIPFVGDAEAFCQNVAIRIGEAINKWDAETDEDTKQEIWAMHPGTAHSLLDKILQAITRK